MKVVHNTFPLTQSANRIGLLCGVVAGTVENAEIEAAVINDTLPRPYRKPVVAEGRYYGSVTEAAKDIVTSRKSRMSKDAFFRAVQSEQKRIARLCNDDCWNGYYWAE